MGKVEETDGVSPNVRNLFCYVKSRARFEEKAFHLGAEEVPPPAGEVCCNSPTSTLCSPDAGLPAAPLAPHAPLCPFPSQSPSLQLSHLHASLCHPMPWQGREQAGEAAGLTHESSHSPQDLPAQLPVPPCALAQPGHHGAPRGAGSLSLASPGATGLCRAAPRCPVLQQLLPFSLPNSLPETHNPLTLFLHPSRFRLRA